MSIMDWLLLSGAILLGLLRLLGLLGLLGLLLLLLLGLLLGLLLLGLLLLLLLGLLRYTVLLLLGLLLLLLRLLRLGLYCACKLGDCALSVVLSASNHSAVNGANGVSLHVGEVHCVSDGDEEGCC